MQAVNADTLTCLNYAREEVVAVVLFFNQKRDQAADGAMEKLTRDLIEVAPGCGGTYYLPYRPHATLEQFRRAYPQAEAFYRQKKLYDSNGIFWNQYFATYLEPPGRE